MNCTNCGSAVDQPTGICGTCGQSTASSPAWPLTPDQSPVDMNATMQFTMPVIEPPQHADDATTQFAKIPSEPTPETTVTPTRTSPACRPSWVTPHRQPWKHRQTALPALTARKRGEPLGPLAFTLSVAGTVVGVVITVLFTVLRFA